MFNEELADLTIENGNEDDERSEMAKEIDDIINGTNKQKIDDYNFDLPSDQDENKSFEDNNFNKNNDNENDNVNNYDFNYLENEEIDNNNINDIENKKKNEDLNNEEKDLAMSEEYYNRLKPNIKNILSSELLEENEIKEQNTKINSLIEELNMISSLLSQMNNNSNENNKKNYDNQDKEDLLDEIKYYEKQIEHLKLLIKVNEGLIESQNEPPKIKEILIQKTEITYENLKYEGEILTQKINKSKNKIKENEILIEELKKKLRELENEAIF